jgi:hypothetical protein
MTSSIDEHALTLTVNGSALTNTYCGNGDLDQPKLGVTNVVIVVHGDSRTACDQARYVVDAATDRGQLGQTLVVAPHFLTTDDAAASQPGRLYWSDGGWKSGSQSLTSPYPRSGSMSSYEVLDTIVRTVENGVLLPDLKRLVIAGHSAGGQLVNRYAATTHLPIQDLRVTPQYVVANPSSYLYFDSMRPIGAGFRTLTSAEVSACPGYNLYKYGLDSLYSYPAQAPTPAPAQYAMARVTYLLGELDTNPTDSSLDTTCAAEWQGPYRLARGLSYFNHLGSVLGSGVYDRQTLTTVPGVGHSAHDMLTSPQGEGVIFP